MDLIELWFGWPGGQVWPNLAASVLWLPLAAGAAWLVSRLHLRRRASVLAREFEQHRDHLAAHVTVEVDRAIAHLTGQNTDTQ